LETGPYANPSQAVLALRRALAGDPGNRTFRLGLMELYRLQGRLEEASALGVGWEGEGEVFHLLVRIHAALGATGSLLALLRGRPEEKEAALGAGLLAAQGGQWDTALALLGRGLELGPEDWEAWLTFCNVLMHAHRLDEALARTDRCLERSGPEGGPEPELRARLGFLKGVVLLLQGRLREGLPLLECRFHMGAVPAFEPLPLPIWRGEDLAGRTLVIQAEQGFGDVFMLARYVPVLAGRGATVLLRPQPSTQGLLATCPGLGGLAEGDLVLPGDALQVAIMSIPGLCGTELASIPNRIPYLKVPDRVPGKEAIDACLAQAGASRRIGLVWAGNPGHARDQDRSMPPEVLDLLADVPCVAWVDLQVGPRPSPRPGLPMLDLAPLLVDFSATAYALEHLDGLISVDSSPVHLAGALGRPAWLALSWLPDWRWMLERPDSPWYPTLELWRQPAPGDWGEVVRAMREALLEGRDFKKVT
jgi:tetratricopeptide (TPR) repeat protein